MTLWEHREQRPTWEVVDWPEPIVVEERELSDDEIEEWKRRPILKERFTFHDLRAKSVSDSSTIQDAFERAGHTSMAMTRGVYDRGVRKVKPLR